MKKVVLFVCLLLACVGMNYAQTAPAQDSPKKETHAKKGAPTKKNGTPDMRYKANKAAADTTRHMKKNGTPDKRYKENKKKS
jgi:hypothetical protein